MSSDNQYAAEIARLCTMTAESHLRAVKSQLAVAFTFCAIAETELRYSRPDETSKVVNKIRHHAETIRLHVDEPNHLPSTALFDLRRQLTQLQQRTNEIESGLRSQ